jgi:hypothetical protein
MGKNAISYGTVTNSNVLIRKRHTVESVAWSERLGGCITAADSEYLLDFKFSFVLTDDSYYKGILYLNIDNSYWNIRNYLSGNQLLNKGRALQLMGVVYFR